MESIYCLKCKKKTDTNNITQKKTKNNRNMIQGTCVVCNTKKSKFISLEGKGVVNNMINKLPFEMHMPGGYNFLGPGTRLDLRLDENNNPLPNSLPINKIDEAAMNHDICYSKHEDTKTRNKLCDRKMLQELKEVKPMSIKEWIDKKFVQGVIGLKKVSGLGNKE